jgi:hypothetical protein
MNDDIERITNIALDEIQGATRRALRKIKQADKEPKTLNLKDILVNGLILLVLIICGLKGFKVDLKGIENLFKLFK